MLIENESHQIQLWNLLHHQPKLLHRYQMAFFTLPKRLYIPVPILAPDSGTYSTPEVLRNGAAGQKKNPQKKRTDLRLLLELPVK